MTNNKLLDEYDYPLPMPIVTKEEANILYEFDKGERWISGFGWHDEGDWYLIKKGTYAYEDLDTYLQLKKDLHRIAKISVMRTQIAVYQKVIDKELSTL